MVKYFKISFSDIEKCMKIQPDYILGFFGLTNEFNQVKYDITMTLWAFSDKSERLKSNEGPLDTTVSENLILPCPPYCQTPT